MSGKPVWLSDEVQEEIESLEFDGSINQILEKYFVEGNPLSVERVDELEERLDRLEELANGR